MSYMVDNVRFVGISKNIQGAALIALVHDEGDIADIFACDTPGCIDEVRRYWNYLYGRNPANVVLWKRA